MKLETTFDDFGVLGGCPDIQAKAWRHFDSTDRDCLRAHALVTTLDEYGGISKGTIGYIKSRADVIYEDLCLRAGKEPT